MDKNLTRMSKFLSLVLRHQPDAANVKLDHNGWVDITTLLEGCRSVGTAITRKQFDEIVATNEKKRFTVEGNRVRAAQGHSLDVDLQYEAVQPPDELYHGTVQPALAGIKREGLKSQKRQHVHLSADTQTALNVGSRRGIAVVITVDAKAAHAAGVKFYRAANGVWLADEVPYQFLQFTVA